MTFALCVMECVKGASNLSGLVVNDLSGFMLSLKEVRDARWIGSCNAASPFPDCSSEVPCRRCQMPRRPGSRTSDSSSVFGSVLVKAILIAFQRAE